MNQSGTVRRAWAVYWHPVFRLSNGIVLCKARNMCEASQVMFAGFDTSANESRRLSRQVWVGLNHRVRDYANSQ